MHQLDTHEEPMILVRKHAVLLSLSPLRAIITADRVILSVPDGADALLYILHNYLNGEPTHTHAEAPSCYFPCFWHCIALVAFTAAALIC